MGLANWIIRAATNNPPKGREQWALAMQAEYASLGDGKLSWALGCWTTMLGWRLRADALYLVVMIAGAYLWVTGFFYPPIIQLYLKIPLAVAQTELLHPYLATMLLVSIALSAFRPDRVLITGLVMLTFQQVECVVSWYSLLHAFPDIDPHEPLHPYNAQYFVAVFAEIGVCFVGAVVGRWIALLWRKRPPLVSEGRLADNG